MEPRERWRKVAGSHQVTSLLRGRPGPPGASPEMKHQSGKANVLWQRRGIPGQIPGIWRCGGEPGQTVSPVTPYLRRALPSSPTSKVLMYLFWETGEGARLVLAAAVLLPGVAKLLPAGEAAAGTVAVQNPKFISGRGGAWGSRGAGRDSLSHAGQVQAVREQVIPAAPHGRD